MRQRGMTYREIEEITGVSHSTVVNWVKQTQSRESDETDEHPEIESFKDSTPMLLDRLCYDEIEV
jgi:transposase